MAGIASEKAFHEQCYAEGVRERLGQFYSVTRNSKRVYEAYLREHGAGKDVLEYGCGEGSSAFFLARHGARVTGIDISEVAIQKAAGRARREGLDTATFRVMDAQSLQFRDGTFDLVCGTGVIHHLDRRRAFAELARVLRDDGSAIFIEPLGHNPLLQGFRKATPHLRSKSCIPLKLRELTPAREYFGRVELSFYHLGSLLAFPFRSLPVFPRLLDALDAADRKLFAALPATRKLAWMVLMVLSEPRPRGAR